MKRFFTFIFLLIVLVFASMAVLGSSMGNNVGKNPNTVLISLPSLYNKDEENADLGDWDYTSEMSLFGSNFGSDGEKIISPGMSNSVEISIENRNDEALDYEIDFSFSSSDEEIWIPLMCKITRYDGVELTDGYVPVETITDLSDYHNIGGYRYAYYVVDWYWPSSEDDNYYGELVLEKDLKIFSTINAKTVKSEDADSTNGIKTEYESSPLWKIVNIIVGVLLGFGLLITVLRLFNLDD